jgi:hypothetical protein
LWKAIQDMIRNTVSQTSDQHPHGPRHCLQGHVLDC